MGDRQAKWRRLEPSEFPSLVPGKYRVKGKKFTKIESVTTKAKGTDDFKECASQTRGIPFRSERNTILKLCMQKKGHEVNFSNEDQKWIDFHKFLDEKKIFPKDLWSETEKRIVIVEEYKARQRKTGKDRSWPRELNE